MTLNEIALYLSAHPKLCHFFLDTWLHVDYSICKNNVHLITKIKVNGINVTVIARYEDLSNFDYGNGDYISRTYKTAEMTKELLDKIINVDMVELYNMAKEPYMKLLEQSKLRKIQGDF